MAITTNDQLIAALATSKVNTFMKSNIAGTLVSGRPYGLLGTAGQPGAFTVPSTLAGNTTDGTTLAGAIPFTNSVSNQVYLSKLRGASGVGTLNFYDMLWWNGGINATLTTPQTVSSPTLPARDDNGSSAGFDTSLWLYVSAAMGAGTPTITVSYTNSDGVAGRTATATGIATAIAATMIPFNLQSGDKGVQSVQSITFSATWTSGTCHLMILRSLDGLDLPLTGMSQSKNFYDLGYKLYNGTCVIGQWIPNSTSGSTIVASVGFIEG